MRSAEAEIKLPDSPHFGKLLDLLDGHKIATVDSGENQIRIINGPIGKDERNSEVVNVEIDFGQETERFQFYPFGVNRAVVYGIISNLGMRIDPSHGLSSGELPKPFMDHSKIAGTVYGFVETAISEGTVNRFKERSDYRKA